MDESWTITIVTLLLLLLVLVVVVVLGLRASRRHGAALDAYAASKGYSLVGGAASGSLLEGEVRDFRVPDASTANALEGTRSSRRFVTFLLTHSETYGPDPSDNSAIQRSVVRWDFTDAPLPRFVLTYRHGRLGRLLGGGTARWARNRGLSSVTFLDHSPLLDRNYEVWADDPAAVCALLPSGVRERLAEHKQSGKIDDIYGDGRWLVTLCGPVWDVEHVEQVLADSERVASLLGPASRRLAARRHASLAPQQG